MDDQGKLNEPGEIAAAMSGIAEGMILEGLQKLQDGFLMMNRQNDRLIELDAGKDARIHDLRQLSARRFDEIKRQANRIDEKNEEIERLKAAMESDHALANAEARIEILERALRKIGWEDWQRLEIGIGYWDFHDENGEKDHGEI